MGERLAHCISLNRVPAVRDQSVIDHFDLASIISSIQASRQFTEHQPSAQAQRTSLSVHCTRSCNTFTPIYMTHNKIQRDFNNLFLSSAKLDCFTSWSSAYRLKVPGQLVSVRGV